jgi:hypothetical protein
VRIKALGDLLLDTKNALKDFARERHTMGHAQRKDLHEFQDGLSKSVEDMLKSFHKKRHTMGSEQAKDLSEFVAALAKDVRSMVNKFRKTRGEMSADLKSTRERDVKNIESYVKNKLKEFDATQGEMSSAMRKSLASYAHDMTRGVRQLLQEYHRDMMQARHFWEGTFIGSKAGIAMPSVETHAKVATVREAVEEERPHAEKPDRYAGIEEKMLGSGHERVALFDVLDKVLEKGAVINGDMVLRIADVDLVFLGLRLIPTSVARAGESSGRRPGSPCNALTEENVAYIEKLQKEIKKAEENIPRIIHADSPRETEQGLAKLILTIIELIRKLMEKEAFRRAKRGSLSPVEIQKLGLSLKAVKKKMQEIQAIFGIKDEDVNLNLGPLGELI